MRVIKKRRYNTKPNKTSFQKGHKRTVEELNANWKGNEVGYGALHDWLKLRLGKPRYCETCGTKKAKKYEWANISGEYRRDVTDWRRLCVSCHRKLDGHSYKAWLTRRANEQRDSFQGVG